MKEPKETVINGKTFILSKFTAIAGREIITQYPVSALPKLGEYQANQDIMLKIMSFVGVPQGTGLKPLMLTTQALIDNHVVDWETLMRLEWEMMEYNCSFFQNGNVSSFLDDLMQTLPSWIIQTLTPLLQPLSATEKPRGKNLKKN